MVTTLLALCGVVLGASASGVRVGPGGFLHDPLIYPEEVFDDDPVASGEVRVASGTGAAALVLEHTSVYAEVHAGLAQVTLTQWFHNPYDEPLEATYLLPLPAGSAVHRMDLTCGDRLIEGFVMEKDEARDLYEEARRDGRKAALLEQVRDNVFSQRIAGLCPGESVEVTVEYVEQVEYEDGLYELSVPMTVGPRYLPPWVGDRVALARPYQVSDPDDEAAPRVDITVVLDEGLPVLDLWSDTHDLVVEDEGTWGAEVSLADGEVVPDRDFVLTWSLQGEQPRVAALVHRVDPNEPGYVALTLEPPDVAATFEPRPRELIFVLDSSGSMEGVPWETARAAVLMALDRMGTEDTFNLLTFSNDTSALYERPQRSTRQTRAEAREWLASHYDGGGTDMEKGIVASLTMPGDASAMRLVLFLTDGFIGGEDLMFGLVRKHRGRARLFSLGVGGAPNRYLLEGLAEMGRGDVIYQGMGRPIAETVSTFYARIARPVFSDIEIDWGGLDVEEVYPSRIPDLWAGQPLRVVARYTPDEAVFDDDGVLRTSITVTGTVGREEARFTAPLEISAADEDREAVATLWARRRIRDLEWYPRDLDPAEVKDAIVDVALEHHLVSRYTSLVAVDDEPSPCGPGSLQVAVPSEAPAGMAMMGTLGLIGAGGMGARGSGIGGGGTASGLGGLGTLGTGRGGYGTGQGLALQMIGTRGVATPRVDDLAAAPDSMDLSIALRGAALPDPSAGEPLILGSMDRSVIGDVIRNHLGALKACYQRELQREPDLAGRLVARIRIGADGLVREVTVEDDETGHPALGACVVARLRGLQFPVSAGGGETLVRYPFTFRPE